MGIMEAVKKGFGIATKNMVLVSILIVFNLVWNIASIPLARAGAAVTPQLTAGTVIFSALFILLSIFIQGSSLGLVRDYLKGGSMKISDFAPHGMKYYLRLLGLGLLIVLVLLVIALVAALIVVATAPLNNTAVTVIATIIALIIGGAGLYYILLLIMSPYALVCDETGVIESMKKSVRVVRKAIGKVLLLLILIILISLGVGFLVGLLTGLVTVLLPAGVGAVVIGVVNSIFNGYLGVVMMAALMSFYLGLTEKARVSI